MLIMQEQEIVTLLCLVGDELQALGVKHPIRLLLIGGAYMLTQIHNRPATRDVDVVVQNLDPSLKSTASSSRRSRLSHMIWGQVPPG
jgi:hypothetical protein